MEEKKIRYYTNSAGEQVDVSTLETTHLINALSKKYREVFDSKNKDEFSNKTDELNGLKEELYSRFNNFNEKLED